MQVPPQRCTACTTRTQGAQSSAATARSKYLRCAADSFVRYGICASSRTTSLPAYGAHWSCTANSAAQSTRQQQECMVSVVGCTPQDARRCQPQGMSLYLYEVWYTSRKWCMNAPHFTSSALELYCTGTFCHILIKVPPTPRRRFLGAGVSHTLRVHAVHVQTVRIRIRTQYMCLELQYSY